MNERMLNKEHRPDEDEIRIFIGKDSYEIIQIINTRLSSVFDLNIELKFPFGNEYGWGYKFSHKTKHLFYLFLGKNSLTLTTQISEPQNNDEKQLIRKLSTEGKKCWEEKYPCKNGGWIHYRMDGENALSDFGVFISLRTHKNILFK